MALALSTASFAQKKTQIEFEVRGVCGMCETRIEKALDAPGIIMAQWDAETQKAIVAYKTKVITEDEIHQLVANVGHDQTRRRLQTRHTRICTAAASTVAKVGKAAQIKNQKTTFLARNNQAFETHFHLLLFRACCFNADFGTTQYA